MNNTTPVALSVDVWRYPGVRGPAPWQGVADVPPMGGFPAAQWGVSGKTLAWTLYDLLDRIARWHDPMVLGRLTVKGEAWDRARIERELRKVTSGGLAYSHDRLMSVVKVEGNGQC